MDYGREEDYRKSFGEGPGAIYDPLGVSSDYPDAVSRPFSHDLASDGTGAQVRDGRSSTPYAPVREGRDW